MRVEILANDRASFIRPIAQGLARMLRDCGAEARLHYDGIANLMRRQEVDSSSLRSGVGSATRLIPNRRRFSAFVEDIREADVIVVVMNVPGSFSAWALPNVELLRKRLPHIPIVNYDLHYLPTLDSWARHLLRGERTDLSDEMIKIFEKGKFGLERYDWYLMASVGTEIPLPPGPQPYSLIGMDIDDGTLYPEQRGHFRALVDFAPSRGTSLPFRDVQLEALRISGLDFEILSQTYSMDKIRSLYRRTSVFLLSQCESFGLSIAEVQGCGGMICIPDPYWAAAHWLGDMYYTRRSPTLSPNFIVYENEPQKLAARLLEVSRGFDPLRVRETFLTVQPELFRGNRMSLTNFLNRVSSGEIHSGLHREHYHIGRAV